MRSVSIFKQMLAASALALAMGPGSALATPTSVDVELQLSVDVSGSISPTEYSLQMTGYSDAFRDAGVVSALTSGLYGSTAVQMVMWSRSYEQSVVLPWMLVTDLTSADLLADAIDAIIRPYDSKTAIGNAIDFGSGLFSTNDYVGDSWVMDVSGDGTANDGIDTASARDAFLANNSLTQSVTINGLVIGGSNTVKNFYTDNVIGGPGSFLYLSNDFDSIGDSIKKKVARETTATPEPGTVILLGSGLVGIAVWRMRKQGN